MKLCKTYAELCKIFTLNVSIEGIKVLSEETAVVSYRQKAKHTLPPKGTNLMVYIPFYRLIKVYCTTSNNTIVPLSEIWWKISHLGINRGYGNFQTENPILSLSVGDFHYIYGATEITTCCTKNRKSKITVQRHRLVGIITLRYLCLYYVLAWYIRKRRNFRQSNLRDGKKSERSLPRTSGRSTFHCFSSVCHFPRRFVGRHRYTGRFLDWGGERSNIRICQYWIEVIHGTVIAYFEIS